MASGGKERGWGLVQHSTAAVPYCPTPELLPASDRAAAEERRGLFCIQHTTPTPFAVLTHSLKSWF